jgi:hypothetical protein
MLWRGIKRTRESQEGDKKEGGLHGTKEDTTQATDCGFASSPRVVLLCAGIGLWIRAKKGSRGPKIGVLGDCVKCKVGLA